MSDDGKQILISASIGFLSPIALTALIVVSALTLRDSGMVALKESEIEEVVEQQAESAMTEEQIEGLLDEYRGGSESTSDDIDIESEEIEESWQSIDFEALQAINDDVYAWISIPSVEIEYPILQHEYDDTYYLNYNIDGSYGYPGCIYTELYNSKTFRDNNTILYGHNMKNGTMFARLHEYRNTIFFEENKELYIYTPEARLEYHIFAAYIYDDRHLMYAYDFTNKVSYGKYLEEIYVRRSMSDNLDENVVLTSDDKIITLVTCIADQPNNRLIVQAVLKE